MYLIIQADSSFIFGKNVLINENGRNNQRNNLMLVKC